MWPNFDDVLNLQVSKIWFTHILNYYVFGHFIPKFIGTVWHFSTISIITVTGKIKFLLVILVLYYKKKEIFLKFVISYFENEQRLVLKVQSLIGVL